MTAPGLLQDKVCFVTGSSRGIGWAIARRFAEAGAIVAINGRGDEAGLHAKAAELAQAYGVSTLALCGDVSDPQNVKAFYARIFKEFKRLDVLVNNAGVLHDALIGMINADVIDPLLRTNVVGVLLHLQAAARLMSRTPQGGSIINIASLVGVQGSRGQTVYAASKAAVIGATKSAARELAEKNVRVNAIAPGWIETEMLRTMAPASLERLLESGMRRLGTPDDVAKVALFLASDLSAYVTGQIIGVDGGLVI